MIEYLWLLWALASAVVVGVYHVVNRYVMKRYDAYAYTLLLNFFGGLWALPFIFGSIIFPQDIVPWIRVIISAVVWAVGMIVAALSYKLLRVSRREPISQTEVVFVLLIAILFLHEDITLPKIVGTGLVLAGFLLLTTRSQAALSHWKSKGVVLTLVAAFLYALGSIIDKSNIAYFSASFYVFLLYLATAAVLLPFLPKHVGHVKKLMVEKWWVVIIAAGLSMLTYFTSLRALQLVEISVAYPVFKLGTLITVALGMLFFREERVYIVRKLAASVLVILGGVLIAGATLWPFS